jgi:ubiquinone/menaquinone biosynthesis C-methylase UbiE
LADPTTNDRPRFCDYEGSDYRTAFWEGQRREYEDLSERLALRRLLPATGQRIVDIGGGFGRLIDLYAGYTEVVLMDHSTTQLRDAQERHRQDRITYVAANLYETPFAPNAFDTAVMVRVIHHLSDVPKALQAIHALLRPGGALVLEYANKRNLKAIIRYLLGRQKHSPFDHQPSEFVELNFNYHPAYIKQHLEAAGFSIKGQLSVSHFRIALLKRFLPAGLLAAIDGWLQQPTARLQLTPSTFLLALKAQHGPSALAPQIFRCPHCGRSPLQNLPADTLTCPACGSQWSTTGGILDFREPLP